MLAGTGVELPDLDDHRRRPRPGAGRDRVVGRRSSAGPPPTRGPRSTGAPRAVGPDDPSDILFTSGTTGVPKGVVQTHGRTLRVATDWVAMTGLTAGDRYLMVNPYFHMFGLKAGILACGRRRRDDAARAGVRRRPGAGPGRRRAGHGAARARRRSTSRSSTTPTAAGYDLSSLRVAVTGAADIPVELIRRVDDELPFSTIITGYGLTEGGHRRRHRRRTTTSRPSPPPSAGRGPASSCASSTATGSDVAAGRAGRDPAARRQHHVALPRRSRGDRGGALGRRLAAHRRPRRRRRAPAACASSAGPRTCSSSVASTPIPAEIENALLRHPDIQQAAVIGIPDERLGEVGMAFVVLAPGRDDDRRRDIIDVEPRADGQLQGAARGRDRRRAAAQRHRQGGKDVLRASDRVCAA